LLQSLFWKISISVGIVVTFTLSVFAFFLIENQKENLLQAKVAEIESVSTLINHGVTTFMKEGRTKDFHNFLNLFGNAGDDTAVRILDEKGTVLHSSRRPEKGAVMAHLLPAGSPERERAGIFRQEVSRASFLASIRAVRNEPACFPCHDRQKKVLGVLHVSVPMEATQQSIRFNRNLLIASTVITMLLMGLAINLLLTRWIKRPTGRLIETMSRVEDGNLDVRVDLGTRDELGRLAQSFSSMVQKLAAAQEEVRRQHRRQLEQVQHLASLGELAAGVAHEIRNPLAGIRLAIQILSREPEISPGNRETMGEILRSIDRLDKTMSDLLLYARVRPPDRQPAPVVQVFEEAFSCLKEEFEMAGIRVERAFDPTLPAVPLDREQIVGVLVNLLLNALQATPRGGTVAIAGRRRATGFPAEKESVLSDRATRENGWVEITVEDTGEGISPEVLKKIFRPFFTTKAKGTGLGLALSRRILEQHGGRIFAESEVGKGARFSLLFPLPGNPAEGEETA
jgi:two-component system, NtrC family, sensor kinase